MRLFAVLFASGLVGVTAASAQMTSDCSVTPPAAVIPVSQGITVVTDGRFVSSLNAAAVPAMNPGRVPYSLVRMNTQVQTLSNGVQITSRTETREWRDAEGRQRMEFRVERNGEMELQNISINDPVLRESIMLHPKAQVAQVTRFPDSTSYQPRPVDKAFQEAMKPEYQPQQVTPSVENKNETLGTTAIAGECAQGTRYTQIIPADAMGNDGELRTVNESWMSPRLGIQLRIVNDDPRTGHMVNEVTELHLEAPDPALFQPPPEYHVFDLTRDPAKH